MKASKTNKYFHFLQGYNFIILDGSKVTHAIGKFNFLHCSSNNDNNEYNAVVSVASKSIIGNTERKILAILYHRLLLNSYVLTN